jgi:ATP-dependent Clp protease adaptor protein ClpS
MLRGRRKLGPAVPERGKMPTWNGRARVFMMVTGARWRSALRMPSSRMIARLSNAMTSTANKSNLPAPAAVAARAVGGVLPRMADDDRKRKGEPGGPGTAVITKTKPQTKRPSMYRVLILNDDYTPMEFVVHVLERFFSKDHEAATRIMLHVHHHGIGECGIYTYEVAETKVTQVMDFARKHQHPLQCVMEKK